MSSQFIDPNNPFCSLDQEPPLSQYTSLSRVCPEKINNFFLGSTRTHHYLSSSFEDGFHHRSPTKAELSAGGAIGGERYFGRIFTAEKPSLDGFSQECLGLYARYNLILDVLSISTEDQIALGRYIKQIQDYYHDVTTTLINELTNKIVKWREYGWWPYLLTPLSLSFWLGGCGQPCYKCAYSGGTCDGHHEGTLGGVIAALDSYWGNKISSNELWPNERFLVDYYGTVMRGPEPMISWLFYLLFRKETCSYCHCILFCFQVQCIDPWFMHYSVVTSVITLNGRDSIPQSLPGKFIDFYKANKDKLSGQNSPIKLSHVANDHVFFEGKVNFHTADIGKNSTKSTALSIYMGNSDDPGGEIESVLINNSSVAYGATTQRSGFLDDQVTPATFLAFRTPGAADDKGYIIRNMACKYHNHITRPDIFRYNWLYVDIPPLVSFNVTPTVLSFDNFDLPDVFFESADPLAFFRRRVYFKTITQKGDIVLNGNGSQRLGIQDYSKIFEGIPLEQRYYPLGWTDRASDKIIKSPYNLYFKSGDASFTECALGETLYDLEEGRYYFPNPYACSALASSQPHQPNTTPTSYSYNIEDKDEHEKHFSTFLPLQFFYKTNGQMQTDLASRLTFAKELLGDPELSAPKTRIEEFPLLKVDKINETQIYDWSDPKVLGEKNLNPQAVEMMELQRDKFNAELLQYK